MKTLSKNKYVSCKAIARNIPCKFEHTIAETKIIWFKVPLEKNEAIKWKSNKKLET